LAKSTGDEGLENGATIFVKEVDFVDDEELDFLLDGGRVGVRRR
jgi:hypothetical protein